MEKFGVYFLYILAVSRVFNVNGLRDFLHAGPSL